MRSAWDPGYVDWEVYADAVATPAPALLRLAVQDDFWLSFGGAGWGFGGEIARQRAAAARLATPQA